MQFTPSDWQGISIRAPLAGSDRVGRFSFARGLVFQSALPLRGATDGEADKAVFPHISIRAPLAGSDRRQCFLVDICRISIRAPLAGSDALGLEDRDQQRRFQSALPLRGATARRQKAHRDNVFQSALPLRGATTMLGIDNNAAAEFQSALPLRGATLDHPARRGLAHISIRAPLAGSDGVVQLVLHRRVISIRAPLAGSDHISVDFAHRAVISIRAPLAGSDRPHQYVSTPLVISIRAPLAGSDSGGARLGGLQAISIRAPLAGSDRYIL